MRCQKNIIQITAKSGTMQILDLYKIGLFSMQVLPITPKHLQQRISTITKKTATFGPLTKRLAMEGADAVVYSHQLCLPSPSGLALQIHTKCKLQHFMEKKNHWLPVFPLTVFMYYTGCPVQ